MIKKIICFQLYLLCSFGFVFGQTGNSFYLMPHLGMEFPYSYFENKSALPPFIKSSHVDVELRYGLSLLMDFDRKLSMEIGYGEGSIGSGGLKWRSQTDSAANETFGRMFSSTTIQRFFFKIHKPVANIKIERSGKKTREYTNKKLYWAIFDVNLMAGITSDNIIPTNWNVFLGFNTGSFTGSRDIISLVDSVTVLNDTGYSLQFGLNLQFYNNGKRRLQLGFIYQQGINRRLRSTWYTSINGTPFPEFDMYSRGSMFAFYAAYPILLFETNRE